VKAEKILRIDGMSCASCVRHVLKALSEVRGLEVRDVEVGSARIVFNPDDVREDTVLHAVRDAGYYAELKD
jgi:copper chaperone CopZ